MARVGYSRVSTIDQNLDRQLDGIPVERVFADKISGKNTHRPKLDELLDYVREGDTLVVHSMDRLARNLDDLRHLVRTLTGRGVQVEFVKENLTFTGDDSPMATLLLSIMGSFAESNAPSSANARAKASPKPRNAASTPAARKPSPTNRSSTSANE